LISKNTTRFKLKADHRLFSQIFLLEILIDFSKNNEESKKYAVYKALEISNKNINILSIKDRLYLKLILKKLINSKYINNDDKLLIKKKFNITI
jgi:hypothetical protein